jgi:hypothetical protein
MGTQRVELSQRGRGPHTAQRFGGAFAPRTRFGLSFRKNHAGNDRPLSRLD